MTERDALAIVSAAVAVLAAGCGGSSTGPPATASTQTHPAATTGAPRQHTGGRQNGGRSQRGGTTTGSTTVGGATTAPAASTRPRGSSRGDQGRPLVRLATACRSFPQTPGGQPRGPGKAATEALALRLSTRAKAMLSALGPPRRGSPATQFLAPLRRTLNRLDKAARRARAAPTRRAALALREAAARVTAAAQQIGVPECALGSS